VNCPPARSPGYIPDKAFIQQTAEFWRRLNRQMGIGEMRECKHWNLLSEPFLP
jgi:hypothetical protein